MCTNRCLLLLFLLAGSCQSWAGTPDWLRVAAQATVPAYPPDVSVVILLAEQSTIVNDRGEIRTNYRQAYKILTSAGRRHDEISVGYDSNTAIIHMKAWAIPPVGSAYESNEKDAIERSLSNEELYSDKKLESLRIPYTEPGTVVGYEYEQIRRSDTLQEVWYFQEASPVREAHFALHLPSGWETTEHWRNWLPQQATASDSTHKIWTLHDVPAIKDEAMMPAWLAVAGRMAVTILPNKPELKTRQRLTWNDFGQWYWQLASPELRTDHSIEEKVRTLTTGQSDLWSKMRALAAFVQRDVRYVAIEIGIGGYQPHAASETLTNHYGDCKDKATLLSAMLHSIGIESYLVVTHSQRGVVAPDFPSIYSFNHMVLAIALPATSAEGKELALYRHPKLGQLLIFDVTDPMTPLGILPAYLQGGRGLLVTPDGGEIIDFPNQPPGLNHLWRTATFTLTEKGGISGTVKEVRSGSLANEKRAEFIALAGLERRKVVERFLSAFLQGFTLQDYSIENLENYDQDLLLSYKFEAPSYAKQMEGLWLIPPRVLGAKASMSFQSDDRKYPVELEAASAQTDSFKMVLPSGFQVDELPSGVNVGNDYAHYSSKTQQNGNVVQYERTYEVNQVVVPVDQVKAMRQFYQAVALDERSSVVLKKN